MDVERFLWFFNGVPMVVHWLSIGFPLISLQFSLRFRYDFPAVSLWRSVGFSMVCPWIPMVVLWFSFGFQLWSCGFPMIMMIMLTKMTMTLRLILRRGDRKPCGTLRRHRYFLYVFHSFSGKPDVRMNVYIFPCAGFFCASHVFVRFRF